ncbi:amidohydrolase [Duganella sp. BJB488]|uniref:amidohydrolase family protein n=1 Tax=unclassified Duganella TaxID=2636909 RepID=UPI000E34A276|nr:MULTISPECIES: amidohydrolase family protein [unclassified Duganella]RFP17861.1 amidohydrolase [Duganella sp. BJB489]RFP22367.1 amidohydrolase [Duganella sp. BJB488]RFP37701.1 amidohydrolase [Duganella sp. BJB480]
MRIDAHQHFWQLAARQGAWPPPELAAIHRDFHPADLSALLTENGVAATVLVQSMPSEADTRYMLDLADRHGLIGAVVGWTDLKAADAPERIAALAAHPKLRGLRPMLQDLDDDRWIDDPALAPAVDAMLRHGLRLDALVLPRHLPALLAFARRHPELPIVIDHAAKPIMDGAPPAQWRDDMSRLAALPQVECKLSGMVTEAGPEWTVEQLRPYAQHVLQAFGPERVMWGSDWPVLTLACGYAAWLDASEALLAHLNEAQRAAVFGLNARRFYRID